VVDTPSIYDTVPTISLTDDELNEAARRIQAKELPDDWIRRYKKAVADNVFGVGHATDKAGRPIEMGIGSAFNQSRTSIEAYRKYGRDEAGYEATLARLEKELAATEARKRNEPIGEDQLWRKYL
jgi:hypothetical protein